MKVTPRFNRRTGAVWASLMIAAIWGIDQGIKHFVETTMHLGQRITVIDGVLWWHYILNPGAAFSMGSSATWVFTLAMAVAVAVCIYCLYRARAIWWVLSLSLLMGGVLGNLTDRLFRPPGFAVGHVVDYISVQHFAIFNFADMCICVSMACIVVLVMLGVHLDGTVETSTREKVDHD